MDKGVDDSESGLLMMSMYWRDEDSEEAVGRARVTDGNNEVEWKQNRPVRDV